MSRYLQKGFRYNVTQCFHDFSDLVEQYLKGKVHMNTFHLNILYLSPAYGTNSPRS